MGRSQRSVIPILIHCQIQVEPGVSKDLLDLPCIPKGREHSQLLKRLRNLNTRTGGQRPLILAPRYQVSSVSTCLASATRMMSSGKEKNLSLDACCTTEDKRTAWICSRKSKRALSRHVISCHWRISDSPTAISTRPVQSTKTPEISQPPSHRKQLSGVVSEKTCAPPAIDPGGIDRLHPGTADVAAAHHWRCV